MVGRLRTSFRSGNLAEHLGILLLKGIAAVAEVPRTEDVGVDAVANLLRRDDDGNCYAEDGFVVQLKSQSATTVEYRDHALSWLLGQSQPMFIGRVSLKDSRISLFPTLHANQAVLALHAKHIIVRFGTSEHGYPWAGDSNTNSATVWLGEPLLSWTLSDLASPTWASATYETLKRFLSVARREMELLSFGQCSNLTWQTNDPDSIKTSFSWMKGGPDDIHALAEKCKPGLKSLLLHATVMPEDSRNKLMIPLIGLVAGLRDVGVDVDPRNMFAKMFIGLSSSSRSEDDADDD